MEFRLEHLLAYCKGLAYPYEMSQSSVSCRSHCPINFMLETFGDRWTLLIVRDLMFKGKRSYGEFLDSEEGISTNILADRLKRLEQGGVIEKSVDPANKSRLFYRLTAKGLDLLPVMLEVTAWSARHDSLSNTPPAFLQAYEADRAGLIAALRAQAPAVDGDPDAASAK